MTRFSSLSRSAFEVLLLVGVVCFVVYDLTDHSPAVRSTDASLALSFEEVPHVEPMQRGARVQPQVDGVSTIFPVCGATTAAADPWLIGNATTAEAVVFQGSAAGCATNPTVLIPNSTTTFAGLSIANGSWLSLQNVQVPSLTGYSGVLTMAANSHLEAVVPVGFVGNAYMVQPITLLVSNGSCPSLANVNVTIANCPYDATVLTVGYWACALTVLPGPSNCAISLNVAGPFLVLASKYIQVGMNKDCTTMTQAVFKQIIYSATLVPIGAIVITTYQCGSITAVFTVLGSTAALADAALMVIYQSMLSGVLNGLLGVTYVVLIDTPTPTTTTTTTTYYYNYPTTTWISESSSNPALFALLTLLVIPLAILLGVLIWCCLRKKPCPCPCPMPVCMSAPVCEPVCAPMVPMGAPLCASVVGTPMMGFVEAPITPLGSPATDAVFGC